MDDIFKKRLDLISDYISQILVYGSDVMGKITIDKNEFEDGDFLILTVSVVKNSYFRWHDLGIKLSEGKKFCKYIKDNLKDKFEVFNITTNKNSFIIESEVNHNKIEIFFM